MNYVAAIDNYYNLKHNYELQKQIEKDKLNKKYSSVSWRERRSHFRKLHYRCINCERYVGTTFQTVFLFDDKHIIAKCGDKQTPCPLDISINLGYTVTLEETVNEHNADLNQLKKKIITDKNNLLFKYITEAQAVKNFNGWKDELKFLTSTIEDFSQIFTSITHNLEKNTKIIDVESEINLGINNIKHLINLDNVQSIKDAVYFYVNEFIPKLDEFNSLLFSYRAVEYNEDTNSYSLINKPYSYEQFEFNIGEFNPDNIDDRIISFVSSKFPIVKRKKERIRTPTHIPTKSPASLSPESLEYIQTSPSYMPTSPPSSDDSPILIKRKKPNVTAFEQLNLETEFIPTMIESGEPNEMVEVFPDEEFSLAPIDLNEE